jgi:hypothetical protein
MSRPPLASCVLRRQPHQSWRPLAFGAFLGFSKTRDGMSSTCRSLAGRSLATWAFINAVTSR